MLFFRELNRAVEDEEAPSSYIKLQLSPSDRSHNKEKTDTIKDTFYPVFNETYVKEVFGHFPLHGYGALIFFFTFYWHLYRYF